MIDEYVPGEHMCIIYWRELSTRDANFELGYKLIVQVNQQNSAKPLSVVHSPFLGHVEASFIFPYPIFVSWRLCYFMNYNVNFIFLFIG